ncbi:transcriptional regulatory protein GlnR [Pseudoclavibacter endophyticus]|uniref:Response regulator transcription factor n=1 Tax=Pseudoclavibacter endophyticus TaxID=1778590 RepID=A0A6H9WEQ8_9MICO|nr:response regulator transcription factor [Pseudoclavibacter endophyticus]KAB1649399.1 response regulator transcription factor [Pseudoclavibacter endophyticus]GGA62960.1 transcriptional regulatory protein GlnR [Pseudoclavibacter endophyticus]
MADLFVLSSQPPEHMLPSLALLSHQVRVVPPSTTGAAQAADADAIVVDGTVNLSMAKRLCGVLSSIDAGLPVLLVLVEGGLPAVTQEWGVTDVVLQGAGPAEVDTRIRLLQPQAQATEEPAGTIRVGHLSIDEQSYTARYRDRVLDLTYKEFELLRYLAAHPEHVFTRERLLSEVWGYDYYGGTRTVDVHVRRLRAKLGDHETVIGTVRNVGYRLLRSSNGDEGGTA